MNAPADGVVLNGPPREHPDVTADFAWWWDGISAGEIRVQRCADCGVTRHPPHVRCIQCGSFNYTWNTAGERGRVYSYVTYHHPQLPGFTYPYTVGTIEVAPGIRVVAPMWPNDGTGISVDGDVVVAWTTDMSGAPWPYYTPVVAR